MRYYYFPCQGQKGLGNTSTLQLMSEHEVRRRDQSQLPELRYCVQGTEKNVFVQTVTNNYYQMEHVFLLKLELRS